ncbi:unnamed protein product, partial [Ceratitis capitata]
SSGGTSAANSGRPTKVEEATPTPKGFVPATTESSRCSNSCTPICLPGHAPNNMQHQPNEYPSQAHT